MSMKSFQVTALFAWLPFSSVLLLRLVVYCLGCGRALFNTQEAMFSHFPVNMQSFFSAWMMCVRALTHYSPAVDLTSCFTYSKPPSDMDRHSVMYTHCSKSNFYEQNDVL